MRRSGVVRSVARGSFVRGAGLLLTVLACGGRTLAESDASNSGGSAGSSDGGRSSGGKSGAGGSSGAASFGGAPSLGGAPTSGGATGTGGSVDGDSPAVTKACLATCAAMRICDHAFTGSVTDCASACRSRARDASPQCQEDYVPFLYCAMEAFGATSCVEASRRLLQKCSADAERARACGLDLPYVEECVTASVVLGADSCYRSTTCNNGRFEVICKPVFGSSRACACFVNGEYSSESTRPSPADDLCFGARTTPCGPKL